jgi:hypothetical protein
MLIKLLPDAEKIVLLDLLELLALSDNPIHWDDDEFSIQVDEQENELIADLEQSAGQPNHRTYKENRGSSIERLLVEQLQLLEFDHDERPEHRLTAAQAVLAELLDKQSTARPEVPKIMLFEMLLVALRDGSISSIEQALLRAFQRHYKVEDFIFDDLLERAKALNDEVSKTIALVLE